MPRTVRRTTPGAVYHVISRFTEGRWFLCDDDARETYLRMLAYALAETDWTCIGYALMSNHLHHAMIAGHLPMQSWSRRVNPQFAAWVNRRNDRFGPVFASRAKDIGFTSAGLADLLAYIHNNPVRAGVVSRARDSSWTSHRAYVGLAAAPAWLRVAEGLRRVGFDDRRAFDDWVDITPGERRDAAYDAIQKEARRRGRIVLATPHIDGDATLVPLVAAPYAHLRPDPRALVEVVADVCRVAVPLICSRRRLPAFTSARAVVVHSGMALGLTKSELASAIGVSPQAIHKLSRRAARDDERRRIELVMDQLALAMQRRSAS